MIVRLPAGYYHICYCEIKTNNNIEGLLDLGFQTLSEHKIQKQPLRGVLQN